MQNIFIYLSGSIQKSHETNSFFWTEENIDHIQRLFKSYDINAVLLNPSSRSDNLADEFSLFGRDVLQVYLSNCVIADGRERRGIGVGYEIAVANQKNIPVFSWVPYDSHYYPKELLMLGQKLHDWRHPFFSAPSALLFDQLEHAVTEITQYKFPKRKPVYEDDFILPAMQHYIRTNLSKDREMHDLVYGYRELASIIENIIALSTIESKQLENI